MDTQNVRTRFSTLTGLETIPPAYDMFVTDAAARVGSTVVKDSVTRQEEVLLEACAAALAFYYYKSNAAGNVPSSFKAGEVSLTFDGKGADAAYKLYIDALNACGELTDTGGFVFGRTDSLCTNS